MGIGKDSSDYDERQHSIPDNDDYDRRNPLPWTTTTKDRSTTTKYKDQDQDRTTGGTSEGDA